MPCSWTSKSKMSGDKVYIITGSSSGIGVGIAECLAKSGVKKLVLVARRKDRLEEVAKSCKKLGATDVLVLSKDLSNLDTATEIVKETIKKFGRIDVVVNNAGYLKMNRPIIEVTNKEAQDMWNLNFMAAFALAREALPHIRKVKGNILFISSVGAMTPVAKCGIYGATKAAMINLAKVMALEEAEHKVRVNVICPGAIMTEIISGQGVVDGMSKEDLAKFCANFQPLPKAGEPEDIGKAVVFLTSDEWAPFATGTNLIIDGGALMKPGSV